ncbi:MAG: glycosyltransferase family 4 protein [Deltaproteobacteria bacterium]|nr:glycosyltransferase family 4 protein [Deltaproteobacteria bacterium]
MNILWIIKRWTMGQDVISDRFGRYYHLPVGLARRGHRVLVLALDYRTARNEHLVDAGVEWKGVGFKPFGPLPCLWETLRALRRFHPDRIVGATDMYFSILGGLLGRVYGTAVVHDVYDHFESYASGRLFKLGPWYYRALDRSHAVIAFNRKLSAYLRAKSPHTRHTVIPNCADPALFRRLDATWCRTRLGLPPHVPLIGYFGAIEASRGMDTLWQAFERVRLVVPEIELVLAGRLENSSDANRPGVRYLGFLPHKEVPLLINACNLNVICYKRDLFAEYSLPFKGVEYMACGAAFVAPRVGAMPEEPGVSAEMLYEPENHRDLAAKILLNLESGRRSYPEVMNWDDAAERMEHVLES